MKFYIRVYSVLLFIFTTHSFLAQTIQQKKMEKLSFMIGDWVGTSTSYKNGKIVKQVPAFQKISFKVDKNIITIDLNSETLKLHTVIYYDEKEETYFYNPYYKNGNAKYSAELKDGKFIVSPTNKKRFVFNITENGNFQEYGETLENGKWIRYFEDNFTQ